MKNLTKKLTAIALASVMSASVVGLAACSDPVGTGVYTYKDYTINSPSNWNELTYKDNNDSQILNHIVGGFFTFDFKFDADGEIIPGAFEVEYEAATALEDVTAEVASKWGYTDKQAADGNYAWKITLREDLKWDDGTAITAADFVYTMQEQLNPLFKNYRASSYYMGSTAIVGAQDYVFQGSTETLQADAIYTEYSADIDSELVFSLGNSTEADAESFIRQYFGFPDSYDAAATVAYLNAKYGFTADAIKLQGKTLAEIKADAELNAIWEDALKWWKSEPNEELHFFIAEKTFPAVDFADVGIYVGDTEYELIVCLLSPIDLLNDDGTLTYHSAYEFSSLPLVHKAKYEASKVAPVEGSTLWTSTYNSSVETTASWGPYKLTTFQTGKYYKLERNEYWYGYNMPENEGCYQTDVIEVETIAEWNTAFLKFQKGEISAIGIDVSVADDYKDSEQAYYTPSDFVGSLQLQSSKTSLENREKEGINKTMLTYTDFRKALSLGLDRADFTKKCTTASQEGFGLFNSMHYYDVANGGAYRYTEPARQVLLRVYGFTENADGTWTDGVNTYANSEEAEEAITGYNPTLAKELITKAYNQALADGEITATDKVQLVYGTSEDSESIRRLFDYLNSAWQELMVGTPLEGRFELVFDSSFGNDWADSFKAGAYDVCAGGWTGMAWNPGGFLMAYLSDNYRYAQGWDPSKVEMTFTMPKGGANGEDVTETFTLDVWYDCLNGNSGVPYNWSDGAIETASRLELIAALEEVILQTYYTVPYAYSFSAALMSYKHDYITYDYNTFMGYGGLKYMTYNYDDADWAKYVAEQGTLNYK